MTESTKEPDRDDKMSSEDYEHLLDRYEYSTKEITMGKILKGRVIKRTPTHVLVDVGFKTEGVIPNEDFADPKALAELRPGSEIETLLEKTDLKDGYLVLSKKRADGLRAIENLNRAFEHGQTVTGTVTEKTKGGFNVDVGIPAFLPESHVDIRPVRDASALIGQTFKFRVLKFDRKTENAVLSRKLLLQDEREKKKRRIFGSLAKGQKVTGHVKSLTNFGAFVDLGGIEGLLHVSDISWGKSTHPSDHLTAGQEVEVIVLDFNERDEKISLGLKQLTPDPWANIAEKYQAGQRITGKVSSLTDFGAFVELEKGVEGLVHISDLTWSRKLVHPKKVLSPGQEVVVTILDVNPTTKRVSLGLKQASPHPLETFRQKHGVGARIKGTVTSLTDFGAFVEVEKGIEGLVHISDISWEKVKHPSEKLQAGQEVEVLVLNIDVDKQKVSLGMKQLEGDIWEDFFSRQKAGDIVKVKIVRLTDFGAFVEIVPGIEGVVFTAELDEKKLEKPSDAFSVGDERNAKIIRLNPKAKKISLSFKQAVYDMEKQDFQRFMESQNDRMTLGDIMKDQLKGISAPKRGAKKEDSHD
ncbi:MAG: 30S ribosomal protein S1 [Candidatus Aminicenantes bacterium RBG_16_63_14]|nr:MAG: 30S ribosomal protein S1 [Candidatus Aminicenantes bacterium RBG_16_63_14]OGD26457.1 MAG: 30S ribosomal protein S1 [Candidatus Aminicenantes bacterium RBG_19FT_COMBO_65_30]